MDLKTDARRDSVGAGGYRIRASVQTDDCQDKVRFDAAGWFTLASNRDIRDLHNKGYRGDPADALAYHADEKENNKAVQRLFRYLKVYRPRTIDRPPRIIGFEVIVNPADVFNWLNEHNPELAAALFDGIEPANRSC